MSPFRFLSCFLLITGAGATALDGVSIVWAAENGADAAPSASSPALAQPSQTGPTSPPARKASRSGSSKGKRPSEKEIEGTEARNRFQADTVLKSKYQFNGESLEVDPD